MGLWGQLGVIRKRRGRKGAAPERGTGQAPQFCRRSRRRGKRTPGGLRENKNGQYGIDMIESLPWNILMERMREVLMPSSFGFVCSGVEKSKEIPQAIFKGRDCFSSSLRNHSPRSSCSRIYSVFKYQHFSHTFPILMVSSLFNNKQIRHPALAGSGPQLGRWKRSAEE